MPMPYQRWFPENHPIQQRFWGLRPRNPTCGLISLEFGTKIYAWGNIVMKGFLLGICILLMFIILAHGHGHASHDELLKGLTETKNSGQDKDDDWIEKMYIKQSYAFILAVLLLFVILCTFLLSIFWKLRKAVIERDVPKLKKYFILALLAEILELVVIDTESEYFWTKAFLFDLPFNLFSIVGLIFTYSFIVSLTNPDDGLNEDTNRIQFNP